MARGNIKKIHQSATTLRTVDRWTEEKRPSHYHTMFCFETMDPRSHGDDSGYKPFTQTPFADPAHPRDIGPPGNGPRT